MPNPGASPPIGEGNLKSTGTTRGVVLACRAAEGEHGENTADDAQRTTSYPEQPRGEGSRTEPPASAFLCSSATNGVHEVLQKLTKYTEFYREVGVCEKEILRFFDGMQKLYSRAGTTADLMGINAKLEQLGANPMLWHSRPIQQNDLQRGGRESQIPNQYEPYFQPPVRTCPDSCVIYVRLPYFSVRSLL